MDKVFVILNLDLFGYCLFVLRIILFFFCCLLFLKYWEEKVVNCVNKLKKVLYNRVILIFIFLNLVLFFFVDL